MAADAGPSTGRAREALEALSRGDSERFARLVHPEVEIQTARGVRRGADEAREWASSTYDHLERRYEIEEMHVAGEDVLVLAQVQYVWRESGAIGDSTPVAVAMRFVGGKLRSWRVYDDPAEGLKVFAREVESRVDC
jgi:ketosteroid isomerase-like protein